MARQNNTTSNKKASSKKAQEITLDNLYDIIVKMDSKLDSVIESMDSIVERVDALEDVAPAKQEKASTKKSKTSSSKKSGSKKSSKSDDFDYDLYKATAKKLGCLGKRGVWRGCREFVYAVMNGEMTEVKAKAKVKAWRNEQDW